MNLKASKMITLSFILLMFSLQVSTTKTVSATGNQWEKIKSYFNPPAELKNNLGEYRSPLKFYDGRPVKSADDWDIYFGDRLQLELAI